MDRFDCILKPNEDRGLTSHTEIFYFRYISLKILNNHENNFAFLNSQNENESFT
jgi:hypothetical protein